MAHSTKKVELPANHLFLGSLFQRLLAELGLKDLVLVEEGGIAQALLKHAGSIALIVVGSRGLDAIDRFMPGSASTSMCRSCRFCATRW